MKALLGCVICCLSVQAIGLAAEADRKSDGDVHGTVPLSTASHVRCDDWPATFKQYGKFLVARVRLADGRYREALAELDGITANTPEEDAIKLLLLGQSYEGLDDSRSAIAAFRKALSLGPAGSSGLLREAAYHYKWGDLVRARGLLYRYTEMEGGNPEAYYYLFLSEDNAMRKAAAARKLIALDGSGYWSTQLFKATARVDDTIGTRSRNGDADTLDHQ